MSIKQTLLAHTRLVANTVLEETITGNALCYCGAVLVGVILEAAVEAVEVACEQVTLRLQ